MADDGRNVFIIGLGLIGGSVALGLKRAAWPGLVLGYDADAAALKAAIEAGAVDRAAGLTDGCRSADLVYLAVPLVAMPEALGAVASALDGRAGRPPVVTDCGSVKEWVCRKARLILPDHVTFVGGHPMAGSEQMGFAAARANLLEGCTYVLTPEEPPGRIPTILADLVSAVGARPLVATPDEHDRAVAQVSHLPIVLATALVQAVGDNGEGLAWELAAGGFRDTTRIASGSPEMAAGIIQANKDSLLQAMRGFRRSLDRLEGLVAAQGAGHGPAAAAQDRAVILNYFAEAKLRRDTWVRSRQGELASPEGGNRKR